MTKVARSKSDPVVLANRCARHAVDDNQAIVELLQKAATQDMVAYRMLYNVVGPRLLRVTRNILRNDTDAEDALQDAFVKIWRYASRYDAERGAPMAWMVTIARNAAFDLLKPSTTSLDERALDNLEYAVLPLSPPDQKLARCLRSLPLNQSHAIMLMYTYGLTQSEIALHLKVPLGTVKSWITRGTQHLRLLIVDEPI